MKKIQLGIIHIGLLLFPFITPISADLLLIGGGLEEDNTEVLSRFIDISGGQGVAKIGCITTASSEPVDSGEYYEDLFMSYGAASATYIPVTVNSNNANSPEIEALIREQTGFFFGGGDQARIISVWVNPDGTDTTGMVAIKEMFNNGSAIGGTSAGAACQGSGPMVDGGLSWQALRYGASPGGYNPDYPDNLVYIDDGGLGNLPGFIVDSHFSERGREGRMIELLLDTGEDFVMGIDENTGIQIAPDGSCEVLGAAGGAMLIDARGADRSSMAPTSVSGIKLSFYTEDDKFNIYDGSSNYASWKFDLSGEEYYNKAESSDNIFSSPDKPRREYGVFRDTAHRLWDSKDNTATSYTYEDSPTFSVYMTKGSGKAYGGYSPVDDSFQVSYESMSVDIDFTLEER